MLCCILLCTQCRVLAEEIEIPPVALDPGIVNTLNRNLLNELMEEEEEPAEESESKEAPEFESVQQINYKNQTLIDSAQEFELKKVTFSGNTIFKDKELIKYFQSLIDKKITVANAKNAVKEINKLYEESGYYTSYAYISSINPQNNSITINVVEGKIGQISIEGNKYSRAFYLKNILLASNGLEENKVFNINNIDKSIEKINSSNYMKGKISIEQDKESENTDLKLKIEERRPINLKMMWDNDGNEIVGQNRLLMLLSKDNLFGLGNQIYGGTLLARGTTGAFAGYKMPIGKYGTELHFDYSFTHLNLLDEYSKISGNAQVFSTKIVQPLYNKNNTEINTDLGIDFVNASSMEYGELENTSISDYTLTVLRNGFNYIKRDKKGILIGRLENSFGVPIMGAKEDASSSFFNNDTNEPQSAFYKLRFNLTRLQKLPMDCLGIFRISTQYTPNNLYATEKMNFGGIGSMRGFEPGETLADVGVNGTIEIRTPIPFFKRILPEKYKFIDKRVRLGFFYDWGIFSNQHTGIKMSGVENFLQSVGWGLHIKLTESMTASWEIGVPIGSSVHTGKDAVMYFSVKADLWDLFSKKPEHEAL